MSDGLALFVRDERRDVETRALLEGDSEDEGELDDRPLDEALPVAVRKLVIDTVA